MTAKQAAFAFASITQPARLSSKSRVTLIDTIMIEILSLLTWNERRHQCAMVCHRWNILGRQCRANIHLALQVPKFLSFNSETFIDCSFC
jgi:hypothetical protein